MTKRPADVQLAMDKARVAVVEGDVRALLIDYRNAVFTLAKYIEELEDGLALAWKAAHDLLTVLGQDAKKRTEGTGIDDDAAGGARD